MVSEIFKFFPLEVWELYVAIQSAQNLNPLLHRLFVDHDIIF